MTTKVTVHAQSHDVTVTKIDRGVEGAPETTETVPKGDNTQDFYISQTSDLRISEVQEA